MPRPSTPSPDGARVVDPTHPRRTTPPGRQRRLVAPAAAVGLALVGCLVWADVASAATTNFTIDAKTGALHQIPDTGHSIYPDCEVPFPPDGQDFPLIGDDPHDAVAVAPNGKYLYTTFSRGNVVVMCAINPKTGGLTPLATPAIATGAFPDGMVVTPNGKYVYVANGYDNTISMYAVSSKTGILSPLSTPTLDLPGPSHIVLAPDGKHAYISDLNDAPTTTAIYAIDPKTGILTATAAAPIAAEIVAVSPKGTFAYGATDNPAPTPGSYSSILTYAVNAKTGALAPAAGAPPIDAANDNLTLAPDGKHAYIYGQAADINTDTDVITTYGVNTKTGALALLPTPPVPAELDNTDALTITPNGKYAYSTGYLYNSASAYAINTKTGIMSRLATTYYTNSDPMGFAITPNGKFAYVPYAEGGLD